MSGESRYAFNRLGLNQLVCYTCTKDKRVTHLTITKVMEKPCPLSTDVQVIENLQESILKSIAFSPCPVARTDPKRFCHIYIYIYIYIQPRCKPAHATVPGMSPKTTNTEKYRHHTF